MLCASFAPAYSYPKLFLSKLPVMFRSTPSPSASNAPLLYLTTDSPSCEQSSSHSSTDDLPKHVCRAPIFTRYCVDHLLQFSNLCTASSTHKVHYQPQQQWDFFADVDEHPVDLSLVLPHYRARNQPPGYRMSIFVHGRGEIKSTVVSDICEPDITSGLSLSCSAASRPAPLFTCLCTRRATPL